MKLSPLFCASVVALAALALTADGASAAKNLNSSKSNIYRLSSTDPNATKTCTGGGGVVATDMDGQKVCATGYRASARGCNVPPCVRPEGSSGGCVCPEASQ